ncbi:MAG: 4Fe-4S ferredoxin [Acidimicrobiales bacterium]
MRFGAVDGARGSLVEVLIIGAGPAAAGAAMALSESPDVSVRVLDVGGRLEERNERARERMSQRPPSEWSADDVDLVGRVAEATEYQRLPEKRNFGSDFPFRDFGQLAGVRGIGDVNTHVISGAYGGFSNTWGAQTMVYSAASFGDWPISRADLEPDYRAILSKIPYSAEEDDLAEYHPLWAGADPLPPLNANSTRILECYRRHRTSVRRHGVIVGKARLALNGSACVSCGLCMTGCPYSYVYSASQTFDRLIAAGRISYTGAREALSIGETAGRPFVVSRDTHSGALETIYADRILVGCGAIGSTRLVASSLELWSQPLHLQESAQFLMPLASLRSTGDLTQDDSFTLNQFNILMPFDEAGRDLVQIHGYPYSKSMDDALPAVLRTSFGRVLGNALLKHVTVGLGYLPSWWSPGFDVTIEKPEAQDRPARVNIIAAARTDDVTKSKLRAINAKLLRVAPYLGVVPVVPMVSMSPPGKSYHFGGSFPHAANPVSGRESDLAGRVEPWRNIHLIDAAVFPNVSATTFTLTIMANAHRIARHVAEDARA